MADKQLKDKAVNIKGKSYVLVSDRILFFNAEYENGAIESTYNREGDTYEFKAVVTPDVYKPTRRFVGHSQATIGDGMVNKNAAMENAETSAVGRALAMMGIGVIESIASADEMNKATGSAGLKTNFATPKQLDWMRQETRKVTGLEHDEDVDQWIKEQIGCAPDKLSSRSVMKAVDKIRYLGQQAKEVSKQEFAQAVDQVTPVTDDQLAAFDKGEIPF